MSASAQQHDAEVSAGLDALQTEQTRGRTHDWQRWGLPLLAVAVLILVWQGYVSLGIKRRDLVPGPMDVMRSLADLAATGQLWTAVGTSLERGLLGFLISVLIATPIGVVLAQVPVLRKAFGPLISGLQVLPSVAWVPAAILWFGLTDATVYFVIFMGAVPSIINGLISGITQIPPHYRKVGTVLGASRWTMTSRIILPAALPAYVGGLRQGWAFSWRSLMAAEIIAVGGSIGFGLGSLLDQGRQLADMGTVLVAVLVILAVGIAVELLVFAPLERRLLTRRGLLQDAS